MFECETCYDTFYDEWECEEHMDNYGHWAPSFECETCDRTFRSQRSCSQHMNDTNHWAPTFDCETCNRTFRSQRACNQHMNDTNHWAPRFDCDTCELVYLSQAAVESHMDREGHWMHFCKPCNRHFQSDNNLQMHLKSSIHQGKNIACPFCKVSFTTASGVAHHLETGSCPEAPQLNRKVIARIINERDPEGRITTKLLEYGQTFEVTDAAWNGHSWECYLCNRQFRTSALLNQHLDSKAHSQNVYRCPSNQCMKEFITLAGLFNHLESESCGAMRFKDVQRHAGNVLSGNRRITFG